MKIINILNDARRYRFKIGSLAALALLVAAGLAVSGGHVLGAGSAGLILNPNSGSYANNVTFTVSVDENSGSETVDSASIDVIYDAGKLQYAGAGNGTAFQLCVAPAQSAGKVSFGCTTTGNTALSGNQTVGTVTFKTLTGSGGSSLVTFGNASAVIRHSDGQNIWNGNTAGGTYSFTTPAPTTAPAQVSGPAPVAPAPAKNTAGVAARPSSLAPATSATAIPTAPNVAAQQTNPYAPVAVGHPHSTDSGQMVAIKVTDNKTSKFLVKATVTLDGQKATTDSTGVASFTNVKSGSHKVTVTAAGRTETKSIEVLSGQSSNGVQQFEVRLASARTGWLLDFIVVVVILAAIVLSGYLLMNRLTGRGNGSTDTPIPGTTAPIISSEMPVIHPDIDKEV